MIYIYIKYYVNYFMLSLVYYIPLAGYKMTDALAFLNMPIGQVASS